MRVANEDLIALKELNDELEEEHLDKEKQLNAEIRKPTFASKNLSGE